MSADCFDMMCVGYYLIELLILLVHNRCLSIWIAFFFLWWSKDHWLCLEECSEARMRGNDLLEISVERRLAEEVMHCCCIPSLAGNHWYHGFEEGECFAPHLSVRWGTESAPSENFPASISDFFANLDYEPVECSSFLLHHFFFWQNMNFHSINIFRMIFNEFAL